jgi:quercetin dioxygenase-like cupin family protein
MWSHPGEPQQHDTGIGLRIRMLREQRNLSQRELARLSDLSPNTLSLIERAKTSPTASTLQKLAAALGVTVSALFEAEQHARGIVFTRPHERPHFSASHGVVENLGPVGTNSQLTPLLITIEPGAHSGAPMTHSGQEFAYCLSGQILFAVENQVHLLEAGDSLLFDAKRPHRWQNAGVERAEALIVLSLSEEGVDFIVRQLQASGR